MAAKNFRDVFTGENQAIRIRRSRAGVDQQLAPSKTATEENGPSHEDDKNSGFPRAGIALSGGGIRSASFGLGFLQAMYRHGILRQVDYLSTVSGGSYVGCYLSSSVADCEEGSITLDPSTEEVAPSHKTAEPNASRPATNGKPAAEGHDDRNDKEPEQRSAQEANPKPANGTSRDRLQSDLAILPQTSGAHTDDLKRLSQAGKALNRPLAFFNRLVLGMLLINLTAFSAIIALAALFAVAYRLLDSVEFQDVLTELGFAGDLLRPWFPAAVLFPIWLFTSWNSRERTIRDLKTEGRWQQINRAVFLLLVASIFMAVASLLTVADPSMPLLDSSQSIVNAREKATDWMSLISQIAVGGVIASLIPYFRPSALIRSGTDPHSTAKDKWIFHIASRALLFGIPLVIFGLICRENISGYQDRRDDRYLMAKPSVTKWHEFWRRVEREAAGDRAEDPDNALVVARENLKKLLGWKANPPIHNGISRHLWDVVGGDEKTSEKPNAETIQNSILLSEGIDNRTKEQTMWRVWNPVIAARMWNPFTFGERVEERRRLLRWREHFIDRINRVCLSDPGMYRYFDLAKDSNGKKRDEKFLGLIEHAKDLESAARSEFKKNPALNSRLVGKTTQADALVQEIKSLREQVDDPDADDGKRETAESKLNQLTGLESAIRKNNWDLLLSHYGKDLRSYDVIFSYVVLDADQRFRLMLAGGFGLICLFLGILLPLNGISIHSYYREQLASVWVNPVGKSGRHARMDDVDTVSRGFPYHVINATLYQFGSPHDRELFVFSPKFCGSHRTGFIPTDEFDGGINLTDAMAVSGAAVSPIVSPNPLVRVLLLLANFRLGEWVPNPARESASPFPPAPLPLLRDMLLRDPRYYNYCFVTDGGLADNTGIASLMHRRCRVIIAVDASQDEDCHFHDLLALVENQRTEFGRVFSGVRFKPSQDAATSAGPNPFDRNRIPLELLQHKKEGRKKGLALALRGRGDSLSEGPLLRRGGTRRFGDWLFDLRQAVV